MRTLTHATKGFLIIAQTEHMRLATVTRISSHGVNTVDPKTQLAIELQCPNGVNYFVISFVYANGDERPVEGEDGYPNRYDEYVALNATFCAEYEKLRAAAVQYFEENPCDANDRFNGSNILHTAQLSDAYKELVDDHGRIDEDIFIKCLNVAYEMGKIGV